MGISGDSIIWSVQYALAEDNVVDLIASRFGRGIHITGTEGTSWALGGVDLCCMRQVVVKQDAFSCRYFKGNDFGAVQEFLFLIVVQMSRMAGGVDQVTVGSRYYMDATVGDGCCI